jgi:hypothetical protein
LGILEGLVPAAKGVGITRVAEEGALTTMEGMGTAVGFCEAKENEGVGPVGVGNRELERDALEPRDEGVEEEAETLLPLRLLDEEAGP